MADTFTLSVLTPNREVFSGEVNTVVASGHDGDFGVLPGHVAYITSVQPGALVIDQTSGGKQTFAIGHGFAQVAAKKVSVIVSSAVDAATLDRGEATAALDTASNALLEYGPSDVEYKDAVLDQAMALGRLRALDAS